MTAEPIRLGWNNGFVALYSGFCVIAGVRGRQPHAEELEGHRHLSAGDRGGVLAHHRVCSRPHAR